MEIIIISAVASNNVIGYNNYIPWHIKEDFLHFKNLTMGYPCLMGDRTYDSLPNKPLPGRENIVLTLDKEYRTGPGVPIFYNFETALEYVENSKLDKCFIIGGASIYKQAINIATKLEITRIHQSYAGDTYFPDINNKWELVSEDNKIALDTNNNINVSLSFQTYIKRYP